MHTSRHSRSSKCLLLAVLGTTLTNVPLCFAEDPGKPILWDKNEKSETLPAAGDPKVNSNSGEGNLQPPAPTASDSETAGLRKDVVELKERVTQIEKQLARVKIQESVEKEKNN